MQTETPADVAELSVALERVASWVRRITPRREFSLVAMTVLDAVATGGPQRITDLTRREAVSQPGMTTTVSRLADAGLVERRPDPQDGRAALVAATDAGRDYLARRHADRAATLADHVARLAPAQQAALLAATDSLAALSELPIHETTQEGAR